LLVQQLELGMHLFAEGQYFWPAGHEQVPPLSPVPAPTQVFFGDVQSVFEQQPELLTRQLFVAAQYVLPLAQPQVPPGPEHVSFGALQSAFVQQAALSMHALFAAQYFLPGPQVQVPPAAGQ
jgi:hypothetical protein